jgi:hypothetical protein
MAHFLIRYRWLALIAGLLYVIVGWIALQPTSPPLSETISTANTVNGTDLEQPTPEPTITPRPSGIVQIPNNMQGQIAITVGLDIPREEGEPTAVAFNIYVLSAEKTPFRRLPKLTSPTATPAEGGVIVDYDEYPAWSPDGKQIAFESNRNPTSKSQIYVMDVDGSNVRRLTNSDSDDFAPAWSPDGKRIAFVSSRDGNWQIYIMNADGSSPRRLTENSATDWQPAWSPDGKHIAFVSDRVRNFGIYVMTAEGQDIRAVTDSKDDDYGPTWSPDGKRIAFMSKRDGNWDIYVIDADGMNLQNLTHSKSQDEYAPAWSPDGSQIAFLLRRSDIVDLFIMNADGTNMQSITQGGPPLLHGSLQGRLAWSSVPTGGATPGPTPSAANQ